MVSLHCVQTKQNARFMASFLDFDCFIRQLKELCYGDRIRWITIAIYRYNVAISFFSLSKVAFFQKEASLSTQT